MALLDTVKHVLTTADADDTAGSGSRATAPHGRAPLASGEYLPTNIAEPSRPATRPASTGCNRPPNGQERYRR